MKIFIVFLCCLFGTALAVFGQTSPQVNYEYGKVSDLKNLKKVFVDTGSSVKDRENLIKEIENAKLDLEFVGKLDEAEMILSFRGDKIEVVNGAVVIGNNVGVAREKQLVGKGMVFLPTNKPDTIRVILNFESQRDKYFEKKPFVKFAREFIKAYREANGLKDK